MTTDDRTAELERTVRELRADLEDLRRSLATEVRTRRVVVVEEDGFERVVVSGFEVPHDAGVHVYARPQGRPADSNSRTSVAIYASDGGAWEGQEDVGVALYGSGNGYGGFRLSRQEDEVDPAGAIDQQLLERYEMTVSSTRRRTGRDS